MALAGLLAAQVVAVAPVRAARPAAASALLAEAAPAESAPVPDTATGVGDRTPSIQYEEAMAHAADRIQFAAGGRVTVPFRPRAGDAWPVGGRAPRALPAGTASGRELRGPVSATPPKAAPSPAPSAAPADAPVDAPTNGDASPPVADGASARLPAEQDALSLDGTRLRRQVMGFLPYWELNSATLDYEVLSTIAYFSVGADKYGNLLKTLSDGSPTTGWGGWTSSRLTSIIDAAHKKGTRVVLTLSVFAWSSGQAAVQGALLGSSTARLNLARQAAAAVRARGADGINLDFEPIASGYDDEFAAFVRTVRAELDKQAPGYQLTFDTTGYIGNYPIEAATAPGAADAIFIMGYDYRTAGSTYVGSIDPLAGPAYDLADTVGAYAARVSPSKLILGVPWYGRAWSTVTDQVNARNQSGTKWGASNTVVYDTAADYAAQYGRRWDDREKSAWVVYKKENCSTTYGCVISWRQLYFDDPAAMRLRYDMINRMGLRGAGIWALGYDGAHPEPRQVIAEKFLDDRTAPLAGIRTLPATQSGEAFTVSWVGGDESGVANYDVQVSVDGGPWVSWLNGIAGTSGAYMGADGHGFAFRARARDTHGNVGAWDVASVFSLDATLAPDGFGRVVASTMNVRAAPSTSATLVATIDAGTLMAITGGPVSADGYTWYEATLPITEWGAVNGVTTNVWVAARSASTTLVLPATAPNATRVDLPPGVEPASGAKYIPMSPSRLLDSRTGNGLTGPLKSGAARTLQVTGRGGVPTNALAITGTLTVVGQTSAGYVSLGPSAATVGRTSLINTPTGDARTTGLTLRLGTGGTLAALWTGVGGSSAHLVLDVSGYFVVGTAGATYVPVSPARVLDTRSGSGLSGPLVANQVRFFALAGRGGVPSGALAVTANVVAVKPTASGYLVAGPSTTSTTITSIVNVLKGDVRAASAALKLDSSGRLGLVWRGATGSRTDAVIDVTGYFTASSGGATYHAVEPMRVLDTRGGNALSGPFTAGAARAFQAGGRGTIPVDAVALTGSLAVVKPSAAGYVTVGPSAGSLGTTSTVNIPTGDVRANGITAPAGASGLLAAIYRAPSGSSVDLVLDVTGYYR